MGPGCIDVGKFSGTAKVLYVLAGLVALSFVSALAQSPKDNFWSDALLSQATSDVLKFDRDQLDTVIEYLATCGPSVDSKDKEFACARAGEILEIKTGLGRLVLAIAITDRLVKHSWDKAVGDERERLAKAIDRRIHIFDRLRRAASLRYMELIGAPRRP